MTATGLRWWPRSLAVRLSVLLIVALAAAQLGLTLLLNRERDSVVEDLLHSQAFSQTVTLARLLNTEGVVDTAALLNAFQSRTACVSVGDVQPDRVMSGEEQQLAFTLETMLHGNRAGNPAVHILPDANPHAVCVRGDENNYTPHDYDEGDPDHDGDRGAALVMDVPLLDGSWLRFVTAIDLSSERASQLSLISFIVSSLAVALVTVWVVRSQTSSLRALANASDRLGRGETVDPLPIRGPSEVDRATDAFNTMQARLSQFMRDRIQLLASISHDLRTPLTTLRLKAEFIEDEATRDDLIGTIDELAAISNAALEFTRAEAASEPTVTPDGAELVGEVIGEFRLADADVVAQRVDHCRLACRPVALKRAVRNLIENAVRYGERARVNVVASDGHVVIQVDDDGPGIPADQMAEVFKPFVRLEPSRNAETGGIGLGLSIAQGIVQAHGGTLTLTNLPDRGVRAEIRLEVATAQA